MVVVGVFVSLPFTIFVFIAGLGAIPDDVMEAATVDGASPWQRYWNITLPLMRPALMIATVLNVIYVFNSFPIIYTLNDRNPGYLHDTTITFMYKLAFKSQEKDVGMSAAAGIFNVAADPRRRRDLPQDHQLARGDEPMSTTTAAAPVRPGAPEPQGNRAHQSDPRRRKRVLMAIGGALVALVFVAPYLVMVLDSLRTSTDVKSTPPSFLPKVWQLGHLRPGARRRPVRQLAQDLAHRRDRLDGHRRPRRDPGRLHDGPAPLPGSRAVPAARARDADVRAHLARRRPLPSVLRAQHDQHLRGADLHERRRSTSPSRSGSCTASSPRSRSRSRRPPPWTARAGGRSCAASCCP